MGMRRTSLRAIRSERTPVRSEPLVKNDTTSSGAWTVGIALIIFGVIGWLSGAKYTLFGWVVGLNLFFAWLGLPLTIPTPTGWWVLAMVPIGYVYSRVEMQVWKAHTRRGQSLVLFAMSWLLIVATDVGTTYLGVRTPQPDAWPITQTIAASAGMAFIWAAILTFVSDWLIIGGWKLIKR
jgi:hypothetical protein